MSQFLTLVGILAITSPAATPVSRGEALMRQVEGATRKVKGFSGNLTAVRIYTSAKKGNPPYRGVEQLQVRYLRPNLFRIASRASGSFQSISDGKNLFNVGKDFYMKEPIDPEAAEYHWYHDDLLHLYVTGSFEKAVEAPTKPIVSELPSVVWKGKPYRVIEANIAGGFPISYRLFVGKDLLVRRIIHTEVNFGRTNTIDSSLEDLEVSPPPKRSVFAYSPPEGLKLRSGEFPLQPGEHPLVEAGAIATDFSLPTPQGGRLTLKDAMTGSRAVLLNFWFVRCPPCRAEHPHLQKLYDELKPKGLAMIAIDDQDTAEESAKYLKGASLTFPVVLTGPRFRKDPKTGEVNYGGPSMPDYASLAPYGVRSCPTNVLIDSATGKVVWRSTGWDEAGLRKALATLLAPDVPAAQAPSLSPNAEAAKKAFAEVGALKEGVGKARLDALRASGTAEFLASPEGMMGVYTLSQSLEKHPEAAKEALGALADLLPKIDHLRGWDGYGSVTLTGLAKKIDPLLGERIRVAYADLIARTIKKNDFPSYTDPRFNAKTVRGLHEKSLAHLTGKALRGDLMDRPAPEMNFLWSSDPKLKKISDLYPGKVVVLDFWATWCKPCIALFPKVREIAASYEGKPVVFVGVTSVQGFSIDPKLGRIDCKGDPAKEFGLMPDLMKQLGITWTVAFSDRDCFDPDFNIMSIPHMAVIDPKGIVRYHDVEPDELKAKIDSLLPKSE